MEVRPISKPYHLWNLIRGSLCDDSNELVSDSGGGWFAGVFDGQTMAGAFLVKPWSSFCYEIHGGIHPDYFGNGPEICDLMGRSLFAGTPCLKIVAIIPAFNRLMAKCLEQIGLEKEGEIKKAFLKHMKLHDLHIYGINKSKVKLERKVLCHHRQQ